MFARSFCGLVLTLVLPLFGAAADIPPGHQTLACDSCHLRTIGAGGSLVVEDHRCLSCHVPSQASTDLAKVFHGRSGESCTTCHSFHHPEELKAGEERFAHDIGNEAVGRHCVACHAGSRSVDKLSDGHRSARAIYHGNGPLIEGLTPSEGCLLCHSRHDADPVALKTVNTPPRFNEHASHPYGARVASAANTGGFRIRRVVDGRLPLFDGRMECQTCHDVTGEAEDLLVSFDTPMDMCLGCHQRTGMEPSVMAAAKPTVPIGSGRPIGMSH